MASAGKVPLAEIARSPLKDPALNSVTGKVHVFPDRSVAETWTTKLYLMFNGFEESKKLGIEVNY